MVMNFINVLYLILLIILYEAYGECAFCDSPKDMSNYDSEKMAAAIFTGICKALVVEVSKSDTATVDYPKAISD